MPSAADRVAAAEVAGPGTAAGEGRLVCCGAATASCDDGDGRDSKGDGGAWRGPRAVGATFPLARVMRPKPVPKRNSSSGSSSSASLPPVPLPTPASLQFLSTSLAAFPQAPSTIASRQLLLDLPLDILHAVLCQLLAPDLCALTMCCSVMRLPPERAAQATVQTLLGAGIWPTEGSSLPHTEKRSWKLTLAFATAFVEGRRGCLAAGEAHTLLLSRRLRRLLPGD